MVSGSSCHPSQTSQPLSISSHQMLGWADVPSGRHPPGGPPSPGLTSADEPLIVYSLLAHATVLPLLEGLQPESVGVDGFKLFRLQWKRNKGYYRDTIRTLTTYNNSRTIQKNKNKKNIILTNQRNHHFNFIISKKQPMKSNTRIKIQ